MKVGYRSKKFVGTSLPALADYLVSLGAARGAEQYKTFTKIDLKI